MKKQSLMKFYGGRYVLALLILLIAVIGLLYRMVDLTIFDKAFLQKQGDARSLRIESIPATRGMIVDREGTPLAISAPVDTLWINPQQFKPSKQELLKISNIVNMPVNNIVSILNKSKDKKFIYLKRELPPEISRKAMALKLPGLYVDHSYKRYYPTGNVDAQLLGFTNIDGKGQEGLELSFNKWLQGSNGKREVIKDRMGNIVDVIETIKAQDPGQTLKLSIDQQIQYQAFAALQNAVDKYDATSGSVVVLDAKTGEILAMANAPSFNPNKRIKKISADQKNRAVTDMFEPGSTIKTFSVVSALDSGKYTPETEVDTSPGWIKVGRNIVRDENLDHGTIDLQQILQKSSNVGITKVILSLPDNELQSVLSKVGFGYKTGIEFPGESPGYFKPHEKLSDFELATLTFGYGIAATPLQLAHGYAVIANGGIKVPLTLLDQSKANKGERVVDAKAAKETLDMLESVVQAGGTGSRARVPGYRIAGKTGTARIAIPGGYDPHRHVGSFVGIAPASNPRYVVAVVISDPKKNGYFGGIVAAPAFSKIMGTVLQVEGVKPDKKLL